MGLSLLRNVVDKTRVGKICYEILPYRLPNESDMRQSKYPAQGWGSLRNKDPKQIVEPHRNDLNVRNTIPISAFRAGEAQQTYQDLQWYPVWRENLQIHDRLHRDDAWESVVSRLLECPSYQEMRDEPWGKEWTQKDCAISAWIGVHMSK